MDLDGSTYDISLVGSGDSWLTVDGQRIISDNGFHGTSTSSVAFNLSARGAYTFGLTWYEFYGQVNPSVDMQDVGDAISQAVQAARSANVALVFVHDSGSETYDQSSLLLPGYQNDLISAVASVNSHTVVVLNTSEPVLMPWRSKVAAILEAWYPGEHDINAIAAVITGRVDPSGRLPITFPASVSQTTARSSLTYPGVDGTVSYSERLDIGYRYYQANGLRPLYLFGYGLSYTAFRFGTASLTKTDNSYRVRVVVKDTGRRSGTDSVQAYLHFPEQAKEPPEQLKALGSVTLSPGESKLVTLSLPRSAFEAYLGHEWRTVEGHYVISIGGSSANLPIHFAVNAA